MKKMRWMVAGLLLSVAGAANAQFSSTVTATSDYDFRGVSQSATDPALQVSLDYGFANGIYVGAWASNIDFGGDLDENVEIDGYIGWAIENENGTSWDFGYVRYVYPGTTEDIDYEEYKAAFGYKGVNLAVWYSPDYSGTGSETWYYTGDYSFEIANGFSIDLHAGYSTGQYFNSLEGANGGIDGSYWDYSVGVSRSFGNFDVSLKYVDVAVDDEFVITDDPFNNEGRAILTISTTFPWSSD